MLIKRARTRGRLAGRFCRMDNSGCVSEPKIRPKAYRCGLLLDRQFRIIQTEFVVIDIECPKLVSAARRLIEVAAVVAVDRSGECLREPRSRHEQENKQ